MTDTTQQADVPLSAAFADAGEERVRAALSAVLDLHRPIPGDWGISCTCWTRGNSRNVWPCPEMRAVVAALEGAPA